MLQTEKYEHHGREVTVISAIKGKHRDMCLCYGCKKFVETPKTETKSAGTVVQEIASDMVKHGVIAGSSDGNCPIAAAVFKNCVAFGIVSPVMECPEYEAKLEC